jgi:DNA invertase Pin-like site-specific DNA recombinase
MVRVVKLDAYVRVSQINGRGGESFASPEQQETACREYAAAQGWDVDEVVVELDVSGATPVDERGLGYLLNRCEAGESDGVICRHLDRFGRNVVEGALAYKRLAGCGARLVAVADGLDSSRDGSKLQFQMMLAFAEQVYDRNRASYIAGKERAVARGVYGAPAPFGYERDENGRLIPNEHAETVRRIFHLRAKGTGFSELARQIDGALTRSGIRRVVLNRAYVGEQRIPDPDRKGDPKIIRDSHRPLVTEAEWEAAKAVRGRAPVHTGLASETQLKGIVRCGLCGSTMHVLSYGKHRDRRTYACTSSRCGGTSMSVSKVEPAVKEMLSIAIADRAPHVAAVIEGDNRYGDALAAVESAQQALAEYRDSIDIQRVLGTVDYAAGLRTRREAVEVARRALRDLPRPAPEPRRLMTLEEFDLYDRRRFYARCIAEVRVFPRSKPQRLTMRWHGSEEEIPVPPFAPQELPVAA